MIIFGVDMPLMEILFVAIFLIICILIANVISLILVLSDVKKLKNTLIQEKSDVERLERDIGTFELDEYKNQLKQQNAIKTYIHTGFSKGYDKDEIKTALVKKGWPQQQVDSQITNVLNDLRRIAK